MSLNWLDVSQVPFYSLLLLEQVQLNWLPGWLQEDELAIALEGNPVVEWFMRHKCPEISPWLDRVIQRRYGLGPESPERIRQAELAILGQLEDLLVYALDPALYDSQPFTQWNSDELRRLTDFRGKTVIDVGSGTGRLALVAAEQAKVVYAVEPVANLRRYIKEKARQMGFTNIYPVDGLITDLPFPPDFADVTMGGHVFGERLAGEYAEMARVTQPGGMLILCPGSAITDEKSHAFLTAMGFSWSVFDEPGEGPKRKYWKVMP
jgi:SAM-dependent methyltransferase